jgi:hypothetical protein
MGIEPTTYSLGSCRSTTELHPHLAKTNIIAIDPEKGRAPDDVLIARKDLEFSGLILRSWLDKGSGLGNA